MGFGFRRSRRRKSNENSDILTLYDSAGSSFTASTAFFQSGFAHSTNSPSSDLNAALVQMRSGFLGSDDQTAWRLCISSKYSRMNGAALP